MISTYPRVFTYRRDGWHCKVEFFHDHVKYSWDKFGWGKEKGDKVVHREALSPHLAVFTGPTRNNFPGLKMPGVYAVLSMFTWVLLPPPWRYTVVLFLGLFVGSSIRSFTLTRAHHWIQLRSKDNQVAVTLQVTKWTKEAQEEFKRFYEEWMKPTS